MVKKYFTVEQANQLIPLVEEEIEALKEIQHEFDQTWRNYHQVKEDINQQVKTETGKLFKLECQLEFIELQAQLHVKNLQIHGVQLKGIKPGLVDFPSFKGKEEILLCWKEGEDKISFYHSPEDGFAGRKPL